MTERTYTKGDLMAAAMQPKPTYRKTYPASSLEMKRRGSCGERALFTDTHCNTEGYPGNFKPIIIPERKPRSPVWATAALSTFAFAFTWVACYLAGCVS